MNLHLNRLPLLPSALLLVLTCSGYAAERPNIVFILCDDLGYGDVHCMAPATCKIATPCADRLAAEGMRFTDAHSGSSVCTPTRYGLMTGRYSWRTSLQKGVVVGFEPSLIDPDRPTVASFLQSRGYHTAAIGKWHLNFQYLDDRTGQPYRRQDHPLPPIGARIPDGPVHRGFDYFHGFHHARDMEAVIQDDRVIEHDATINMLPRLARQSVRYIEARAADDQPFFLYIALGSPHTPIVPSPAWQGKSSLGSYGDFVMETDAVLGAVSEALERHGLTDDTLLIFTSDNGCSKAAGIDRLAAHGHQVSAHLRGSKADIWDGGHRVPFIARWPGKIKEGATCDQLICLTDLFATVAEIVDQPQPPHSAEDSVSFLPALRGRPIDSSRRGVVHHSISGHFAYRSGAWKLALARASGGWSKPTEKQARADAPPAQLYDMSADVGETDNLYSARPQVVKRLLTQLQSDVQRGRSTAGPPSENDVSAIDLWKSEKRHPTVGAKEINPPAAPDGDDIVVLAGGRLIDGRGGAPVEDSVVVVRGAKVVAAGLRDVVKIPASARVLDISGQSILPGLIDSHFHSRNDVKIPVEYALKRGVTSFRDPGHPFRFYQAVMQATEPMPRVFLCGAHLDAHPPVWPDQAVVIRDSEHARQTVHQHVDRGASAIKVYFRLPLKHIRAACQAANERGVLVTAHLELVDADEAIAAGVRGIEHVTSFGTALAETEEAESFRKGIFDDSSARRQLRHRLWASLDLDDSARVAPLLDLIVHRGVYVSPTLAIFEARPGQRDASEVEVQGFANMIRFTGLCHQRGAKVVVGSHTSAPFAERGEAYQRELELLVQSGMTPLQAITAATLHNAKFLGIADRLGTLEAGKTADLIITRGDPSHDIKHMADVSHVMLNGMWIGPSP